MNVNRIRLRLTLGYVGIFALTLLSLGVIAVLAFQRELTDEQDALLTQEARNQADNLLEDDYRKVLAESSDEFAWITLSPEGRVMERGSDARPLGLPSRELAREALREDDAVSATIRGRDGMVRAVSVPMRDSGELIGVVQYARSLREVRETVRGLVLVLLPLGLGALGLATIGGSYMAGRAVRPVRVSFERQRAFIADASHELKTPLTLIRADTEVLQRGLTQPDDRELAEDVLSETEKMSNILSDLLLTARLDAGKLPVELEDFDLASVIRGAADRFGKQTASRDLRLEIEPDLAAHADATRTAQILGILLDNALAHTPQNSNVTVTARARENVVEIAIRDSGPGISPEHRSRIFERFYRVDKARSRSSGGTGLGLSIARELARAQGGDLIAENPEGGGAVFRLELPRTDFNNRTKG